MASLSDSSEWVQLGVELGDSEYRAAEDFILLTRDATAYKRNNNYYANSIPGMKDKFQETKEHDSCIVTVIHFCVQ